MGVISRVRLGFAAVAFLLLMVGATSYFEFRRLNATIEEVTSERNQRNILVEELLANIYKQSSIVSSYMVTDSLVVFNRDTEKGLASISRTLKKISQYETNKSDLIKVENAISEYSKVIQTSFIDDVTTTNGRYFWYSIYLMPAQQKLGSSVLQFLNSSHKDLTSNALSQLNNVYRSDLKILITLLACMFIIFMFYILIKVFYLNPIINIKNRLESYLDGDNYYDAKDEGIDEVKKINNLIEQVIQNCERNIDDNNNISK